MWGSTRHIITGLFTALAVSCIAMSATARTTVYSEDFDGDPACAESSNPWTDGGVGVNLSDQQAQSSPCSLAVGRTTGISATSPIIDLSAWSAVDVDAWVYEDAPETGDRVDFQYQTSGGSWVTFETYERASGQNNNFSVRPAVNEALPAAAIHANSRFRVLVVAGSGSANDRWLVDDFTLTGTASAGPQTLTVTNTNASGAGSLPQAITDANNNPGPDTIVFNVPGSGERILNFSAAVTITDDDLTIDGTTQTGTTCGSPSSGTPPSPVLRIDGTANGTTGGNYHGFRVNADNVTIRGFAMTSFDRAIDIFSTSSGVEVSCNVFGVRASGVVDAVRYGVIAGGPNASIEDNQMSAAIENAILVESSGTGTQITGNIIGDYQTRTEDYRNQDSGILINGASSVTIGGMSASDRNIISDNGNEGIELQSASNITILGNYIGLMSTGTSALGNSVSGLHIENSSSVTVGNGLASGRNIIAGNGRRAINVVAGSISNLTVDGNYLGTDVTGNTTLTNGQNFDWYFGDGISFGGGSFNNIQITDNVIGGLPGAYIEFYGTAASNVTIQGNSLGVGANGTANIGTDADEPLINISGGTRNYSAFTIGGTGAGEGNIIANGSSAGLYWQSDIAGSPSIVVGNTIRNNAFDGIIVQGSSSKLAVFANSIFDNGGEGIDLGSDGITPNDNNDGDGGTNDLLNFPVINSVTVDGTTVNYDITLDTVSHGEGYRVDFYRDNSSGELNGEGETWLGFVNLTYTGVTDDFTGSFTAQTSLSAGDIVTAKTTRRTSGGSYDQSSEFGPNQTATSAVSLGSLDSAPPGSGPGSLGDPFTSLAEAYTVSSSGQYYFNMGSGLFLGSVDTSEGGGWVLVLQYIHAGGANPPLSVTGAGSNLPRLSSSALGADESAESERWGHAGNTAMSQFTGDIELRWYAETNAHNRIIHFRSSLGDDYVRTGTGGFNGIQSSFTALTNHSANLPASASSFYTNRTDYALTSFPYWLSGTYHWGVRGEGGLGSGANGGRWEVDDHANSSDQDTIHRVWVRDADPLVVTNTNDTGEGSLRQAITVANGSASEDNITFDISGSGPFLWRPASDYPTITDDNVSIDGPTSRACKRCSVYTDIIICNGRIVTGGSPQEWARPANV
ncbi:MAG: right-handed parallel beta-helix repeat-containing protein, partial [Pseudomonadota bacterium]